MSILKQPLIHFLLIGGLVFAIYDWRVGSAVSLGDADTFISRDSFIEFIQYRHSGLGKAAAEQLINDMPMAQKNILLQLHIKEEVLFREALTLGLNKKDYVIKQRLIQKMEYLLGDAEMSDQSLAHEAVADYYQSNKQRFYRPALLTFAQVFIDFTRHSPAEAQQLAMALKGQLNKNNVPFENAARYGERFVYFTNYVERDKNFVSSHFGHTFADTLFLKDVFSNVVSTQWQGPIISDYGLHLVLIAQRQAGGVAQLAQVYNNVVEDLRRELSAKQLQNSIQILIENYNVDVAALEAEM